MRFLALIAILISPLISQGAGADLTTVLNLGTQTPAKVWTSKDLLAVSKTRKSERDPRDGKSASWKGVLVTEFLDSSLNQLPAENRAQVDLLVFHGTQGEEVALPRWLVVRYPLMIGAERNHSALDAPSLVIPWTSDSKILKEALPVEAYFIPALSQVEFTSYKLRYGSFFLQTRTDPAAMRGEKYFVQNCTGCHGASTSGTQGSKQFLTVTEISGESRSRNLASGGHPSIGKSFKLTDLEKRALVSYLNAYRQEHPGSSHSASAFGNSASASK